MQSALLQYMLSKYYFKLDDDANGRYRLFHCIPGKKKYMVSILTIEQVMIMLLILWRPFKNFRSEKNPLRMTALHRLRYYYCVLSMHDQNVSQNKVTPMIAGPH